MKTAFFIAVVSCIIFLIACSHKHSGIPPAAAVNNYYLQHIKRVDTLAAQLQAAVSRNPGEAELQQMFKATRLVYKRVAFLVEYLNPDLEKLINGPPVPEVEEEDNQNTVIKPEGFQVIETLLFPSYDSRNKVTLLAEISALRDTFKRLQFLSKNRALSDSIVFRATRKEVFRVITLGIAGYDSDVAHYSIAESQAVWITVRDILELYRTRLQAADPLQYTRNRALLDQGIRYLGLNKDFNAFNRMQFITLYANPLSVAIRETAITMGIDMHNMQSPLKADIGTLFDKNVFDINFYVADVEEHGSREKEILGRYLFFDPMLSGNGKRSCASCHQPEKAFSDGIAKNATLDGKKLIKRNTLTLLNAGLQPGLFYDLRVTYLEDQVADVLASKDEMHGSVNKAIALIRNSKTYPGLFRRAFPRSQEPVTPYHLQNAIGSYIRSLTSLNAPFDRYMRGDSSQLTSNEVNGFNLYMGKAKCATCHFIPLFNGTLPPDFNKAEMEVIGVPVSPDINRIDTDKGRYLLHPAVPNLSAFRVPTLRNIALTAPYMHNGIYATLNKVMDFYNKGGGIGLGIRLTNQTLSAEKLGLTVKEQEDIIAFLKKLTDTSMIHAAPEGMLRSGE